MLPEFCWFNSKDNSIQSIDYSQGIIDPGRKVPKNFPKSVQNKQKRGLFIKNSKHRFKIWFFHSFHCKIQFKGLINIIFSGIFNSKPGYRPPLFSSEIRLQCIIRPCQNLFCSEKCAGKKLFLSTNLFIGLCPVESVEYSKGHSFTLS